jgi:nitroreductase
MTDEDAWRAVPIPPGQAGYLITTAARAPSVQNTQPWRFRVSEYTIELYADPGRKLNVDPAGREMLISCGAALYGLRLAVRSLGYLPIVEPFPDPARLRLLARVTLGRAEPITLQERKLLEALPHRHTHRGPWAPGPLPAGLVAGLQHDALAEGAQLALVDRALAYHKLADLATAAGHRQDRDPAAREEMRQWSRDAAEPARDGVPAHAFPATPDPQPGRLPQRDFDLGRGLGLLPGGGPPPAATAILLTSGDGRADWLRAGQALHRLLAHAASKWVFASLHTQPLENEPTRTLIRDRLALPGSPQMLLQLGPAHTTHTTARRPPADLTEP